MDPVTAVITDAGSAATGTADAVAGNPNPSLSADMATGTDTASTQGESDSSGAHTPASAGSTPAPGTTPGETPPEPRANVTARLAALSRENREAKRIAREAGNARKAAEARAAEAAAKISDFDALIAKAKADPSTIPALVDKLGITFERIVESYAASGEEATAEAKTAKELADIRAELAETKKLRETELAEKTRRAEESQRTEVISTISQRIEKAKDKFEICARLGDEAANDVFKLVVATWEKAGRPELMPGEFEEAVDAAMEVTEAGYEDRGKKLAKAARAAATPGATATNDSNKGGLVKQGVALPDSLTAKPLSDKDQDILRGLTDKTAPAYDSQRAKPRTINSSLGGSAPPRQSTPGAMDPRDALREVLRPYVR